MTDERRRRSLRELEENAARGIIDEPEIVAPPYDQSGTLTPEGAEWLRAAAPDPSRSDRSA
jgi:hypothetical protein